MSSSLRLLQILVFLLLVRPFLAVFLGLRVRHRERLPAAGPAILVANHNSHLDTLVLMAALPPRRLWLCRPVAAADHFRSGPLGWLARRLLRAILVPRCGRSPAAALAPAVEALDRGEILILFPEGSRGRPEVMGVFKRGVAELVRARPAVPVIPVRLQGLGRCLPKASLLFLPFDCHAVIGPPADLAGLPPEAVPAALQAAVSALAPALPPSRWAEEEDSTHTSRECTLCTESRENGDPDARAPRQREDPGLRRRPCASALSPGGARVPRADRDR